MAVTASRLGHSPITLDWSNLFHKYDPDQEELEESWNRLKKRLHPQDVGFYDSPVQAELSQAAECQALADSILKKQVFTDCLFLGIGGSALGPMSLLAGLQEKCTQTFRFHFVENPDPLDWKATLHRLRPETTLVCAVSKSGSTFETLAQTILALEWLGKPAWKTHLVIITDPTKGDLRAFAEHEKIPTLSISPSIGGRFSAFSPVCLFPALLAGLSIDSFLLGAKQVRDFIEKTPPGKNPLFIIGSELLRHASKRSVHICMPYSTRLKSFGAWFVQLWSESLGKEGKGFSPLAAVGSTDQHSILQLLRDGPDDKITFFLTIDQVSDEIKIPKGSLFADQRIYPAFQILESHTLHELLQIEYQSVSRVLTKQSRPHLTFSLDQLDERCMGALYFAFAVLTAFTGTLWSINPFDQPGVEEAKGYIRKALSNSVDL